MWVLVAVGWASPLRAELTDPEPLPVRTERGMTFEAYRGYVDRMGALAPGVVAPVDGGLVYGFNVVLPGSDRNLSWALARRKGSLTLGIDQNSDGYVSRREWVPLRPEGEGYRAVKAFEGLPFAMEAKEVDGSWRVGVGSDHVRRGTLAIEGRAMVVELRASRGAWGEGLLGLDLDGDGSVAFGSLDPEVRDLAGGATVSLGGTAYAVEVDAAGISFAPVGPADGPGWARLTPGELVTGVALDALGARGGLLLFVAPRCGFCRELEPELAALDLDVVEVFDGTAEEAAAWGDAHGTPGFTRISGQESDALWRLFGVRGTPAGALVDADGRVVRVAVGLPAIRSQLLADVTADQVR